MNGLNRLNEIIDTFPEENPVKEISVLLHEILNNVKLIFTSGNYNSALNALVENESLFYEEYFKNNDRNLISEYENAKGFILLKMEQIENSRNSFETALKYNPVSSDACLGLGEIFLVEENIDAAKVMLEWAVTNDPDNQAARLKLNSTNNLVKNNIINNEKSILESGFEEAYELFSRKEFASSIKLIEDLESSLIEGEEVDQNTEDITSLMNLKGFNYLGLKDINNAQMVFEVAVNLNPNSSQANVGMGEVYYLKELDNLARNYYEKAVSLNQENQLAKSGLQKLNHNDEKAEISGDDKVSELLNNVYTNFERGDYNGTLLQADHLEKSVDVNDKETLSAISNIKGYSYLELNKLSDAQKSFENALQLNPQSSQACAGLGQLYLHSNMLTEAKVMFEWALKYNQDNKLAINGIESIKSIAV